MKCSALYTWNGAPFVLDNAERFTTAIQTVIRRAFNDCEEVRPVAFFVSAMDTGTKQIQYKNNNGAEVPDYKLMGIFGYEIESVEDKNEFAYLIKQVAETIHAVGTCFASEVWMLPPDITFSSTDAFEKSCISIVQHPDRRECVSLLIEHRELKKPKFLVAPILRNGGDVRLGEFEEPYKDSKGFVTKGRFANVLPATN